MKRALLLFPFTFLSFLKIYAISDTEFSNEIRSINTSFIATSLQASDTVAPVVTLTDSDVDNILVNSDVISITAVFSESIKTSPTLTVSGTSIVNRPMNSNGYFQQLGSRIDGEYGGDFGRATALNGNGTLLVVGDDRKNNGVVRVYRWVTATQSWVQYGTDLDGVSGEEFGVSVDINDSGNRIIASTAANIDGGTGTVRIYEFSGGDWQQMGGDLTGATSHYSFGTAVGLNASGDTAIIGEPYANENPDSGGVYVYTWDGTDWNLKGTILRSSAGFGSHYGGGIAISDSGDNIAVGAPADNQVFSYDWNGANWVPTGTTITGSGRFGSKLRFNSDGSILAVGAEEFNSNRGEIKVYEFSGGDWQQMGNAIAGGSPNDPGVHTISFDLSADGYKLAFGDYLNNGKISLHYWNNNNWDTSPTTMSLGDENGFSVALNNNGTILSVGPRVDNYARVYDVNYKFDFEWTLLDEDPLANGAYSLTVSGTDFAGNANAGTTSITFTVSNTLDTTPPTLNQFRDSDLDNIIRSGDVILFTAVFSENMAYTPTISISNVVTNVAMVEGVDRTTWTYNWQVSNTLSDGSYSATVSGTSFVGNAYVGTDSITLTIQNIVDTTNPSIIELIDDDNDNIIGTDDTVSIDVVFSEALLVDPEIEIRGTAVVTQTGMTASNKAYEFITSFSGDADGDNYGEMVKISQDGLTVAVGAPDFDANGNSNAGKIEIFRYDVSSMTWAQLGGAINGPAANHRWGANFDLSGTGNQIIAAFQEANSRRGLARVYELTGGVWTQVGPDFTGVNSSDRLGFSVAINANGNIIVIGSEKQSSGYGKYGIYQRNGGVWELLGTEINGTTVSEIGRTVDMDDSGYRIVSGNSSNDTAKGMVKVFEYTPSGTSSWTQVGADIKSTLNNDLVGSSVAISGDGNTIGTGSYVFESTSGRFKLKTFSYDQINNSWVQKGSTFDGGVTRFGSRQGSTSFNKDGSKFIVGAWEAPGNGGDTSGRAYVYDFSGGGWTSSVSSLQGSATTDNFGRSTALNDEGTIMAIGEVGYEKGGDAVGRVRIFNNNYWRYSWVIEDDLPLNDGVYTVEFSGEDKSNNAYSGTDSITFTLFSVTGSETLDYPENAVTSIASYTSSIPVSWALSGVDSSSFTIDTNGVLNFNAPPQFATPTDSDADNIYNLTVIAAVGSSTSSLPVSITVVDLTPPSVNLSSSDTDNVLSQTDVVTITASFSKTMAATPTITISGLVTNVLMSGANSTWTYLWDLGGSNPAVGNYTATVSGTDTIGNAYSGTDSITFYVSATSSDTTPPTVILSDTDADNIVSNSDLVTITATFSEAMAPSPMINIGGVVSNGTMTMGSTNTIWQYLWDVGSTNPANGSYTVTVMGSDLAANSYTGTDSLSFQVSNTIVDTTPPSVILSSTDADNTLTVSDLVTITATFSEAVTASPTLSISGIVSNAIMNGAGNTWTYLWDISLSSPANGNYSATVSATDLAGNAYTGTDSLTFTIITNSVDNTPPTVVLTDSDADNIVTRNDDLTIVATFSETMRATPTLSISSLLTDVQMTGSGTTWSYTWDVGASNPMTGSDYIISVKGQDLAGNNYAGSDNIIITVYSVSYDPSSSAGPKQSIIQAGNNGVSIRYMDELSRPVRAYIPKGKAYIFCHQDNSITVASGSYTLISSKSCN